VGLSRALTKTVASLLVVGVLAGCTPEPAGSRAVSRPSATTNSRNPIVVENAQAGSAESTLPSNNRITGYADATSVDVGETIRFAVSSARPSFKLDIYRLGWYGGPGGRLMLSIEDVPGIYQGHWIDKTFGVAGCTTCRVDPVTGLVDANWEWGYSLTIPSPWTSGLYLARLSTANDRGTIPFVVRDNVEPTSILAVLPVNTWQAYNYWGGKSLRLQRIRRCHHHRRKKGRESIFQSAVRYTGAQHARH